MQGTVTQTPHSRCSFSLQYAPRSTARTPQHFIIPRHQPFISIASKTCTTTRLSYWRNEELQQPAKQSTNNSLPTQKPFPLLSPHCLSKLFHLTHLPSKPSNSPSLTNPRKINHAAFIKKVDSGLIS
jgi:hypothetical protein